MMELQPPPARPVLFRPGSRRAAAASTAVLLFAAAETAALQSSIERVQHALEIDPETIVTVLNFAGQVDVHATDPGEDHTLRVVGVKRLTADLPEDEAARWFDRIDLEPDRLGRHVHIGPRTPGRSARRPEPGADRGPNPDLPVTGIQVPRRIPPVAVDIELWLPFGSSLEVRTFSAPITVTDVGAPEGSFRLRSVSGGVTVEGLEADDLRVETVSGPLRLRDALAHRGHFQTLTASIHAAGRFHPDGWYDFQTHSGAIVLELDPAPGFALAARTYRGEIRNDLAVEFESGPGEIELRTGASGTHLSVNTFEGLIHVTPVDAPGPTPDR